MRILLGFMLRFFRTIVNVILVILLCLSLLINAAAFSIGAIGQGVSSAIEAMAGFEMPGSRAKKAEADNVLIRGKLASEIELSENYKKKAASNAAAARTERASRKAAQVEVARLKVPRRVIVDGVEMAGDDAVKLVARRNKQRLAKWAATDLSATVGQAIPGIGIAVVVSATAYDLKQSCDTMKDMHSLELAFDPSLEVDESVKEVCGLRVPTAEEVWILVKESPSFAWDAAKSALSELPTWSEISSGWLPSEWPSLPEVPVVNWKFWE